MPRLKRGNAVESINDRIKLESVLGLTVSSNAALDCDPKTEVVAYPAGCTVVLYNIRKNRQSHILNASRKTITCVAYSSDGRYLATGESGGQAPAVRVWDLQDPTSSKAVQIAEFPGHSYGVSCVAFSTSSKYLISVGSQHDMIVNVWDWRANLKLASNKVSVRVKAISFSENGNYFVTVGFRHVKFWYLEYSKSPKIKEPVPLMGRSAILGQQKDNEFCDVVCGKGQYSDSTYVITRGGLLCEFNGRRLLDKWVELRTTSANCLAAGNNFIFVGCADGIVRCFSPENLRYITTLPRTHYLGVDVAQGTNIRHMFSLPSSARYPDAVALTYDELNHKLTCVYNDHSLYVWDVNNIKRVGKSHSALYHSACIWGVEMVSDIPGLPGTFMTCSSDDTIRLWHLDKNSQAQNIYSMDLMKIIYIDPELKFLKDIDLTTQNDKTKSYDEKIGVRCVRISPDGNHIASGDRAGNVRIHKVADGSLVKNLEAHDAEVLCLEYSPAHTMKLLASASRDRLIHVFEVEKNYKIMQTLDDHSSSITAVKFLTTSSGLLMVSCGADKTILFRNLIVNQSTCQFVRSFNVAGRTTLYDMEVDAGGRHILIACQDRYVRVYYTSNGRHTKTFRGTTADEGTVIKVSLDKSGIYLATSCTDKVLSVYDYYSNECMATMYGHSELVTGLRFTPDCQHLISASGDGCIFIWSIPHDMVVTMKARLAQQAIRQGKLDPGTNGISNMDSESESHFESPLELETQPAMLQVADYTLSIGRLPSWAQKSLGNTAQSNTLAPEQPAKGKWATRITPSESKESSIDSGTDLRYGERQRETKQEQVLNASPTSRLTDARSRHLTDDSSLGSFKYEEQESTEHDGDVEDISDGERTSSSERGNQPTYYPGNNDEEIQGEFMVKSIDEFELLQTKKHVKNIEMPTIVFSGSDDEASTPSGDGPDRSHLSGSSESIDKVGTKESFIKIAYDSLSGAETGNGAGGQGKSLSSQHVLRMPATTTPVPAMKTTSKVVNSEAKKRREDLQKRILQTRQMLDSMSRHSKLKSSQSTMNLSYGKDKGNGNTHQRNSTKAKKYPRYGDNQSDFREENLDSLNSNYYDSLNQYQNHPQNIKSNYPYDIPANMNTLYYNNENHYNRPYVCDLKSGNSINKKETVPGKPKHNCAFTVEIGNTIPIQSKVFDRLFNTELTDRNTNLKPTQRNFTLNLNSGEESKIKSKLNSRSSSILKNYKSCPVSPVSEECKWSDVANHRKSTEQSSMDQKKRNSLSFYIDLDTKHDPKSKFIADTIKSNTQKIIAEIKQKYGTLDEINNDDLDFRPSKEITDFDGDANFSSDSLEDCSLSQDMSCKNKLYSKRICKKHSKNKVIPRRSVSDYEIYDLKNQSNMMYSKPDNITAPKSSTLPRNMPFTREDTIEEDYNINFKYSNMYRCQSVLTKRCITRSNESVMSDNSNSSVSNEIFLKYGNEGGFQQAKLSNDYFIDGQDNSTENVIQYCDNHRHSSASFFLNQRRYVEKSGSQDSILSDETFDDNPLSRTNCNSLESILSDDSEYTKSAPLEMLFEGTRPRRQKHGVNKSMSINRTTNSCYEFENTSKSYGSSPNNPSAFGTYMCNNYIGESPSSHYKDTNNAVISQKYSESTVKQAPTAKKPQNKYYGFQVSSNDNANFSKITRSKSLYDSSTRQSGPPPAKNIAYYFDGNSVQQYVKAKPKTDEIPRLDNSTYMTNCSKSLLPKCAEKDKYKSAMSGSDSNTMVKSKSCSFEVVLEPAHKQNPPKSVVDRRSSHVQKNLEKFEEQIRKNAQQRSLRNQIVNNKPNNKLTNVTKSLERGAGQKNVNNKIAMEFVPHKPPKPKRTSSVKINKSKLSYIEKSSQTTPISSNYKAKLNGLQITRSATNKRKDDLNIDKLKDSDGEICFDVFIKEKDFYENCSVLNSFEVDEIDNKDQEIGKSFNSSRSYEDLTKGSLDYLTQPTETVNFKPCSKEDNIEVKKENNDLKYSVELQKYNIIKRKLDIVNKLVEMEERKILQEKFLKEFRMKPLRANFDDSKGVVKVLSRKFENLATTLTSTLTSSKTLEEIDIDSESDLKEIKRNHSLPDILDSEQIYGQAADLEKNNKDKLSPNVSDDKLPIEIPKNLHELKHESNTYKLNNTVKIESQNRRLKKRVYNEMILTKADVHLDSENYESSTTSSSCANSPKRFGMLNRYNALSKYVMRVPTPRLCMTNRMAQPNVRCPVISCSNVVRTGLNCQLARKAYINTPMLPSRYMPTSANNSELSAYDYTDEETPVMRRAISLSDLATTSSLTSQAPQQSSLAKAKQSGSRSNLRHSKSMVRAESAAAMNLPSDSESEVGLKSGSRNSYLMRPTISSMNKTNTLRRRGLSGANSLVALSTATHDGSSSEAEDRPVTAKPVVPPRPRSVSTSNVSRIGRGGNERGISAKAKEVTMRLTTGIRSTMQTDSETHEDQPLSTQLCTSLTEQLIKTANKIVHLYRNLQQNPSTPVADAESADVAAIRCGLEAAILETQNVLRGAVVNPRTQNGSETLSSLSSNEERGVNTNDNLTKLLTKDNLSSNSVMNVIDITADIFMNSIQNKVNKSPQPSPAQSHSPNKQT